MNNKHLLIAVFATAFSGMNLVASEEVSVETTIVKVKAYKNIVDKGMRRFCRETNNEHCPTLELLMTATDKDLEAIATISQSIKEQMKSHSILKDIVEDVKEIAADAKEIIDAITEDSAKSE